MGSKKWWLRPPGEVSAASQSCIPGPRTHRGQTKNIVVPNAHPSASAVAAENVKLSCAGQSTALPTQRSIHSRWIAWDDRLSNGHRTPGIQRECSRHIGGKVNLARGVHDPNEATRGRSRIGFAGEGRREDGVYDLFEEFGRGICRDVSEARGPYPAAPVSSQHFLTDNN